MRNIAIIDADLIGKKRHRFPNLVCMKLSGWHKSQDDNVSLKLDYSRFDDFDCVYIAKVFTDTAVPSEVLTKINVQYGGTGFFYDKAKPLPPHIEHTMPDYSLYDDWIKAQIDIGKDRREFRYYTDYSVGFLTRGCFRRCGFCVNKNYTTVKKHSPLSEFLDANRKKICLLDDNFLGCADWKNLLLELHATGKPFVFKQGLDERLLDDEKCELLFSSKYDGDYLFAFDNLADREIIEQKIRLMKKYTNSVPRFYCLTGFDREDKWDTAFWRRDIGELLQRIEILRRQKCLPYVMRFNRYVESPYRGFMVSLARWCNQPQFFKKKTLREFAAANGENSACFRSVCDFEKQFPEVAYFLDLPFGE